MTAQDRNSSIHYWLPLVLWAVVILAVSSIPGPALLKVGFSVQDSVAHAVEYSVLGFLAYRWQRSAGRGVLWSLCTAAILGSALGGLDELYQRYVPGRVSSTTDLLADGVGASLGASVAALYYGAGGRDLSRREERPPVAADETPGAGGEE